MAEITFSVEGKEVNGYLAVPASTPAPGLILLHAWWGLNSSFQQLADRLAGEGFVVFAPDLVAGKIATTVEQAQANMNDHNYDLMEQIVYQAVGYLRSQPAVAPTPLGVIGFSMGAAWSVILSIMHPAEISNVVLFYGQERVDFQKVQARFQGHYALEDEWEPLEEMQKTESAIRQAGREVHFYIYPHAKHWFMETNRPEYDPELAQLAWLRVIPFLRE